MHVATAFLPKLDVDQDRGHFGLMGSEIHLFAIAMQGHGLLRAIHSHRTHAVFRFWHGLLTVRGEDPESVVHQEIRPQPVGSPPAIDTMTRARGDFGAGDELA